MYGEAVKDEYVASVDRPTNPIPSTRRLLRDIAGCRIGVLKTELVRAFQNLQRTQLCGAVVKRYPGSEAIGISCEGLMVLMGMDDELFAVRKDQPCDRFWVDEKLLTDE